MSAGERPHGKPGGRSGLVRPGVDRSPTEHVWPSLIWPAPGSVLVYLDLNHWISLAKAATGHRDGVRFLPALQALRGRPSNVIVPLLAEHFSETAGITDPRQRADVASVMEELSGFHSIVSGVTLMKLEVDAAVARATGTPEVYEPVSVLGRGVMHAFGRRGGLQVRSAQGDVTAEARAAWRAGPEAFDEWQYQAERQLDRSVLRGPTDAEAPEMRARGWDPTVARRIATERAEGERAQAARLAVESRWRRGRLRDVVAGRYMAFEIHEELGRAVDARGIALTDMLTGPDSGRAFTDGMPSADVRISLLTAAHRNPQTAWTPNDMFDIDALSVAVSYCDIVVTERHAHHVLHAAGLPERLGTTVLAALAELVPLLAHGG